MNEEIDVNEILAAMRLQFGLMAQENAILAARLKKLEDERNTRNCSCNPDN